MILIILNCFLITFVITTIIDISGFITDFSKLVYKILNPGKEYQYQIIGKPFGCSYCLSFWIIFIYLSFFNFPFIYAIATACVFTYLQILIKIILIKINNKLNKKLYDENNK